MASPAGHTPAIQLLMLPLPVLGRLDVPGGHQRILICTLGHESTYSAFLGELVWRCRGIFQDLAE